MARVELRAVNKVYPGGVSAVIDVSLEIMDREFLVLVGPSGCGKSTTLRLIAGLEEVSSGDIFIGDRRVNDVSPKDRDIAMVFQNYALYPHMTVFKNMAFGLKLRRYKKKDIRERVMQAAKTLGIEDVLDRRPKSLSGGQRQRVAVGRAIVRKPSVFLFDEPLSNLDAKLRLQMRAEISRLHGQLETTMIYVTHDQVEAMTMGDRIVVMEGGLIRQVATPTDLYQRPANRFVAGFIGSPPMNFLKGSIETGHSGLFFRSAEADFRLKVDSKHEDALSGYADKDVVMGLRPEDLHENSTHVPVDGKSIQTTVEVVEPLGAETYLYLDLGGRSITSRIQSDTLPRVNEAHVVDAAMAKAHYFDTETDKAILK